MHSCCDKEGQVCKDYVGQIQSLAASLAVEITSVCLSLRHVMLILSAVISLPRWRGLAVVRGVAGVLTEHWVHQGTKALAM